VALYAVESDLKPEDVIGKAKGYFGDGGLGLDATERNPCCVYFEGGGGHVTVTASEGDGRTQVQLETREWDNQVKQFMHEIKSAGVSPA
jgi:hypothetical protein